MKKIIIILLLATTNIYSQKYVDSLYNFKLEKGNIIWQKVFKTTDIEKTHHQIKTTEFTNKLKDINNVFSGRTTNTNKRVVKNTPYFATFGFDGYCLIEFKENRYRTTIKDITFRGPNILVLGVEQKLDYPLQNNVVKKGKIKTTKRNKRVLQKLDSIITSKIKPTPTKKEDW